VAAFQPEALKTIFSPDVNSALGLMKEQFDKFIAATKQNFGKFENEVVQLKEEVVELKEKVGHLEEENVQLKGESVQLKGENVQLKGEIDRLKGEIDQLKGENGRFGTRIAALQEQVDGYSVIAESAPEWITMVRKNIRQSYLQSNLSSARYKRS
jgi:uncharacterized coiled-coil DUF342 family protein